MTIAAEKFTLAPGDVLDLMNTSNFALGGKWEFRIRVIGELTQGLEVLNYSFSADGYPLTFEAPDGVELFRIDSGYFNIRNTRTSGDITIGVFAQDWV